MFIKIVYDDNGQAYIQETNGQGVDGPHDAAVFDQGHKPEANRLVQLLNKYPKPQLPDSKSWKSWVGSDD